ncbi:unnamed protein product, partial [Didymodactylos carnosus]
EPSSKRGPNLVGDQHSEQLEFDDENKKTMNVTKQRATLLLIGVFIFRALVTTLLCKPIKYRLMLGQISSSQQASLKVLATLMLYIGRCVCVPAGNILRLPHEWQLSLLNDDAIEHIVKNPKIKLVIQMCEVTLRKWCDEYIHRIDSGLGKQMRF